MRLAKIAAQARGDKETKILEAQEELLAPRIEDMLKQVKGNVGKSFEMESVSNEIEMGEQILRRIGREWEELLVERSAPPRITPMGEVVIRKAK